MKKLNLSKVTGFPSSFAALSLSTIERAERGESIRVDSIQRLCACLSKTPEQLGLLHGEQEESESDDMNRRQTLQMLGTGTALLVGIPPTNLPLQEIEHLFSRKMARLQTWIVEGLEDGTRLRWQLYYTSRNTLTEDGLLNQIMKLELLADDGGKDHARICQVLVQNYHLAHQLESKSNINWSREIHAKLQQSRWKNESVVEELQAAISQA